ncbi:MAG: hypothetical protein ACRDN0_34705 [Trebonia sp.]
MTVLDAADLAVIAGRVLGIGTDAALAQMDVAAARDALAGASPSAGLFRDRPAAAAAGVGLLYALLRHRPFPRRCEQIAVAAGLQFLSLNGWRADLNPPAPAAVVVEALASGQLTPEVAATWLTPRLTPAHRNSGLARTRPSPMRRAGRGPSANRVPVRRAIASALLALAVGGVSLLAAACSRGPTAPASPVPATPASVSSAPASPAPASPASVTTVPASTAPAAHPVRPTASTVPVTPGIAPTANSRQHNTAGR